MMSAAFHELIEALDRVRMRLSADHALAVFINSSPTEEELEIAAAHFALWLHEHDRPGRVA
jgi:hypothetical protein